MQISSDFRLYHSNALSVLAALLAETLRKDRSPDQLLVPETILIPQPSMKRWLQLHLATSFGVVANLHCITPGEFVTQCLQANLSADLYPNLSAEAMRWRLFAALNDPQQRKHKALKTITRYLDSERSDQKVWALASQCAAAFEKYQAWRRDWCLAWDRGEDPADWQAHLWRVVTKDQAHRAKAIDDYLQRFENTHAKPQGLPSRVFAFACSNVSPDVLRVIATASKVGPLHFFLASPCKKYWGDVQNIWSKTQRYSADVFAEEENPLLQQWGYAGRDFIATLFSNQHIQLHTDIEAYAEDIHKSLLSTLKNDVLSRTPPTISAAPIDVEDISLQIHSCHTRLREVQVLHDQLHRLFLKDLTLQARDITVMSPNIQDYAPFIEAVFGAARFSNRFIPYSISDQASAENQHVGNVFLRFFELPKIAFNSNEVLSLLSHPAMLQALNVQSDCLPLWSNWVEKTGARWGLNAQHRQQLDAPADHLSTWAFALERILLGYASANETPIAGVEPVIDIEGQQDLIALDALIRGLRMLSYYQMQFRRQQSVHDWASLCTRLINTLFAKADDDVIKQAAQHLHAHIAQLLQHAEAALPEALIAPDVIHAYFQEKIESHDGPIKILSGGVSFCRMVPMRQIPFQVICLLGMNQDQMPRKEPPGMIQRLQQEIKSPQTRRYGDRSTRDDDRFLFLQLMMAAEKVFYLSYSGRDAQNNSPLPPSALISELIDVIAQMYPHEKDLADRFTVQHPLQVFSTPAKPDSRQLRFDSGWQNSGNEKHVAIQSPLKKTPAIENTLIDVKDFLAFFQHPAKYFLRRQCGVQLNSRFDVLAEEEPFEASQGLEGYDLRRNVFQACLQEESFDIAYWLQRFRQQALLPSGLAAQYSLNKVIKDVYPLAQRVMQWRQGEASSLPIHIKLDNTHIQGQLDAVFAQGLERIVLGEAKAKHHCQHAIELRLLSAMQYDVPVNVFHLDSKKQSRALLNLPISKEKAVEDLKRLLKIYQDGQQRALAFLPEAASAYFHEYQKNREAEHAGFSEASWQKARDAWPNANTNKFQHFDIWCATTLRDRDPFLDAGSRPDLFESSLQFHTLSLEIFSILASSHRQGEGEP
jgi:exodeoxyribonuclease V gamma subunit